MRTIGWLFILFAVWLVRAMFKGQITDASGKFILPQVIEETLVAIITGNDTKLTELDAQAAGTSVLDPIPAESPPDHLGARDGGGGGGSWSLTTDGSTSSSGSATGQRAAVVAAAHSYSGDKYSQLRRTQPGYSDCSSFVAKALKKAGIKPPGPWPTTYGFLASKDWLTIPASQVQAGDIAVTAGHMVLMTGPGQGIGQQRPGVNVRTGSIRTLFGSMHPIYKTYRGYK
jgi:cell wall-associated NlpC family hydrolase